MNTQFFSKYHHSRFMPWLVWFVAALLVPYQFLLQSSTSVMIPQLMSVFHINAEQVGLLTSSFFYSYLLLQIPAGILVDKFGAKILLIMGMILCSLATIFFSFTSSNTLAIISRIIMGVAAAPAVVAALCVASEWFDVKKFAILVGFTELMGMLGGAVGESSLAHWVKVDGWRMSLMVIGLIGLIIAIIMKLFIKSGSDVNPSQIQDTPTALSLSVVFNHIMKKSFMWWCGLFSGFSFAILPAFAGLWAIPFLQIIFHYSLQQAAFSSTLLFIGAACAAPLWGWLYSACRYFYVCVIAAPLLQIALLLFIINTTMHSHMANFFTSNHSEATHKAATTAGAAATPMIIRLIIAKVLLDVKEKKMVAKLHKIIPIINSILAPNLSTKIPAGICKSK